MPQRSRATVSELRTAIQCLPRGTRIAMLQGITQNEIVVGAYTHEGGICPMLAAHRAGGRTSFISFAKAWDRFAFRGRRERGRKARRATERELLTLRTQLEASLLQDAAPSQALVQAIAEHREFAARTQREHVPNGERGAVVDRGPGDRDRTSELRTRPGWSWTRLFRRYDDYQRALARLEQPRSPLRERSLR